MIPSELCIPISERKSCSPEGLDSYQSLPSTVFSRNTAAKRWITTRRSAAPHICSNSSPPSTPCLTHGCLIHHRESCSYQLAVLWKAQECNMPSASLPLFTTFTPLSETEECKLLTRSPLDYMPPSYRQECPPSPWESITWWWSSGDTSDQEPYLNGCRTT